MWAIRLSDRAGRVFERCVSAACAGGAHGVPGGGSVMLCTTRRQFAGRRSFAGYSPIPPFGTGSGSGFSGSGAGGTGTRGGSPPRSIGR